VIRSLIPNSATGGLRGWTTRQEYCSGWSSWESRRPAVYGEACPVLPGDIVLGKFRSRRLSPIISGQNGIHLVPRAAPCNDISLAYSFSQPFTGVPATGETRVLAVVLDRSQKVGTGLSIMCLPLQTYSEPKLSLWGRGNECV
jgi:hypothetical protein